MNDHLHTFYNNNVKGYVKLQEIAKYIAHLKIHATKKTQSNVSNKANFAGNGMLNRNVLNKWFSKGCFKPKSTA